MLMRAGYLRLVRGQSQPKGVYAVRETPARRWIWSRVSCANVCARLSILLLTCLILRVTTANDEPSPWGRQYETLGASKSARPSFVMDAGSGVLLQPAQRLLWTQSDNGDSINWHDAKAYCAAKGTGWRLPTLMELTRLMGEEVSPCGEHFLCEVSPLFRLTDWWFWSSESAGVAEAWDVSCRSSDSI